MSNDNPELLEAQRALAQAEYEAEQFDRRQRELYMSADVDDSDLEAARPHARALERRVELAKHRVEQLERGAR